MMKKRILISASLFHALTDASTVVIPTVFPILLNQGFLITRYSQIGLLSNLGLLATLMIQFGVVRLSYRRDYRVFLLASGLGICAALALTPFARSFAALLILFFILLRGAASVYHPLIIAWISKSIGRLGKRAGHGHGHPERLGERRRRAGLRDRSVFWPNAGPGRRPCSSGRRFGIVLVGLGS